MDAVLVTGAFGVGKSTVVQEMAEIVEVADVRYAALDLDWLMWGWPGEETPEAGRRLLLDNLASVAANYRRRGVDRFVLGGTVQTDAEVTAFRRTLDMPMRVVSLTLPIDQIRHRLASSPNLGRREDLRRSEAMLAEGGALASGDLVVANDRPVREVAGEILEWLEWLRA
jgi:hypothetical protein